MATVSSLLFLETHNSPETMHGHANKPKRPKALNLRPQERPVKQKTRPKNSMICGGPARWRAKLRSSVPSPLRSLGFGDFEGGRSSCGLN